MSEAARKPAPFIVSRRSKPLTQRERQVRIRGRSKAIMRMYNRYYYSYRAFPNDSYRYGQMTVFDRSQAGVSNPKEPPSFLSRLFNLRNLSAEATGYIGASLSENIRETDYRVVALTRSGGTTV